MVRKPRLKSAETDALGHRSQVVYDERGRQIETIEPLGGRWKKEYDQAGRVTAEENPMGERTLHEFDADGRLIKTTDPLGRIMQFVFDADNNQVAVVEPDGTIRVKEYNGRQEFRSSESRSVPIHLMKLSEKRRKSYSADSISDWGSKKCPSTTVKISIIGLRLR